MPRLAIRPHSEASLASSTLRALNRCGSSVVVIVTLPFRSSGELAAVWPCRSRHDVGRQLWLLVVWRCWGWRLWKAACCCCPLLQIEQGSWPANAC